MFSLGGFRDMDRRETFTFLPLLFLTVFMGVYPEVFLNVMHISINNLLDQIHFV